MCIRLMILVIGWWIVADPPRGLQGAETREQAPKSLNKLWAGINVNQALFSQQQLEDHGALVIRLALVNDGAQVAATEVNSWRIIVNGKEMSERNTFMMFNNGSRMEDTLPPGGHSKITKAMGIYFKKPGIYKVSWTGKTFSSPEITFRVLPTKKN